MDKRKSPRKGLLNRDRWYPQDPSNNISCNITAKRKIAADMLARTMNITVGSLVREALERRYGKELDAIEETL